MEIDERKNEKTQKKIEYDAIVAICNVNRGIGKDNDLPWSLSDEYNYFRRVISTTRDKSKMNAMIMGRLSWESVPLEFRPFQPGLNVIISTKMTPADLNMNPNVDPSLVIIHKSIESALDDIRNNYAHIIETIYCLGGCDIYR